MPRHLRRRRKVDRQARQKTDKLRARAEGPMRAEVLTSGGRRPERADKPAKPACCKVPPRMRGTNIQSLLLRARGLGVLRGVLGSAVARDMLGLLEVLAAPRPEPA